MADEILDLVDDNDNVVGRLEREKVYAWGLSFYIRGIVAFVVNDEGKLWIPRRTAHKKLYKNALDFSVAGHIESGESYEKALFRETQEELNIDLQQTPYKEMGYFTRTSHPQVPIACKLFFIYSNQAPDYNPDDFVWYEWLTVEETIQKCRAETVPIKSNMLPLLEYMEQKNLIF